MPDRFVTRSGRSAVSGARKIGRLFETKTYRSQLLVALLVGLVGFGAAVQIRVTDQDTDFTGARQADLIALINSLETANDRARNEIADLERTRDALLSDAQSGRAALELAREQEQTLGVLTGSLPVRGPGIRVTVAGENSLVGTEQVLDALQELRDAGAEAIEIDERIRVVAQTAIEDAPNGGLLVGGVPISSNFSLEAIGDPGTLDTALRFDGGFIDRASEVGGEVTVERRDTVEISSVADVAAPDLAEAPSLQ